MECSQPINDEDLCSQFFGDLLRFGFFFSQQFSLLFLLIALEQ